MTKSDHRFVSLPLAMTRPVGKRLANRPGVQGNGERSLGGDALDQFGRQRDVHGAPCFDHAQRACLSPGAISQSSSTRWFKSVTDAGTMVRPLRAGSIAATKPA